MSCLYKKPYYQKSWPWYPKSNLATIYVNKERLIGTMIKLAKRQDTIKPITDELINLYKNGPTKKKNQYGPTMYDIEPLPIWGR